MNRLIVVSNRVADLSKSSQSGGLAVALIEALRQRSGLWFGWDGNIVGQGTHVAPTIVRDGGIKTITLPLTKKDYCEYYAGFSNSVLWPVCHYRLDLVRFGEAYLQSYQRVNSKFADALSKFLEPDDVVWVHDYHLIPLASELRRRGHRQKIGFFLHIPFPPLEILSAAPEHEWLVRALFAYDLVGFQTEGDVRNLENYICKHESGSSDGGCLRAFGSEVRVGHFPIGIDVEAFAAMARAPAAKERIERLQRRMTARTNIIGVDRLDYSKGLPERLRAFRRLLELYPENQKAVTLMQIASPTRQDVDGYAENRRELEHLSGEINGTFGDFDWTPLRCIHRNVSRETLAALFRGSSVGLVTPLRDGMNLVAKEYVAAQNERDPGVLILSQFAGAAAELEEALIVNPYNVDEVALALQRAIRMPLEERRERHAALQKRVEQYDVYRWSNSFLATLDHAELGVAA